MRYIKRFCRFGVLFYDKKAKFNMTKSYFYQVKPVHNLCSLWCAFCCAFFAYIILGNEAIVIKHDGFLHILLTLFY